MDESLPDDEIEIELAPIAVQLAYVQHVEEFIPLKKRCYEVEDKVEMDQESEAKKNWMSSVQLWNHFDTQNTEFNPREKKLLEINKDSVQESVAVTSNLYAPCRNGTERSAFVPFKGYPAFPILAKEEDLDESLFLDFLYLFWELVLRVKDWYLVFCVQKLVLAELYLLLVRRLNPYQGLV